MKLAVRQEALRQGTKYCARKKGCGALKPLEEFGANRGTISGKDTYCLVCSRKKDNARRPKREKADMLRKRYRMSLEDRDAILQAQGNVCGRCRSPFANNYDKCMDHDHVCCPGSGVRTCGRCIRGIVCRGCNALLKVKWCLANPQDEYLMRYQERRAQLDAELPVAA